MEHVLKGWILQKIGGTVPTALVSYLKTVWILAFQHQHMLAQLCTNLAIGVPKTPERGGKKQLLLSHGSPHPNSPNRPRTSSA